MVEGVASWVDRRRTTPGLGAHLKNFLKMIPAVGLPTLMEELCLEFADLQETRFARPPPLTMTRPPRGIWPSKYITWASLNVRSIYGREKTLCELMIHHKISFLALQETFVRPDDPPEGLFASTYSTPGDKGRRGVMIIVHPALERTAQLAPGLGGSSPNIIWVKVTIDNAPYLVASVYVPDNSKNKDADLTVRQILKDLDNIPGDTPFIVMGDWNYDPFADKGRNRAAFRLMMSHPRVALVRRQNTPIGFHTTEIQLSHRQHLYIQGLRPENNRPAILSADPGTQTRPLGPHPGGD